MITTETPYKLAEIVRDTWPQLQLTNPFNKNEIKISIGSSSHAPSSLQRSKT